ncbi:MAG TPA: hypothetical protein PLV68_01455 [Ilumatobacteraceae bacterium]|nr:hypothetical protein [Ilumatobacteraceae bacterium]
MVQKNIARARQRHPDATPAEVLRSLERMYLAALTGQGAAVGGVAAAPGVGTGAALALSGGEVLSMLELSALFALSLAEVHELERRRTLVMGILLGGSGSSMIPKVAGRTAKYWGREVASRVPVATLKQINKVLGKNFVTKFGTKQGIIVIGRVAPFGIGAAIGGGANALLARSAIQAGRRAFGPAPRAWSNELHEAAPPKTEA